MTECAVGPSRTQMRRRQRQHSVQCWKLGALQRVHHSQEVDHHNGLVDSKDAQQVLHSIAIHRADCVAVDTQHHFAAHSNLAAHEYGFKTKATFQAHRRAHKSANKVKHSVTTEHDLITSPFQPVDNSTGVVPFSGRGWNINAPDFVPAYRSWSLEVNVSVGGKPLQVKRYHFVRTPCAQSYKYGDKRDEIYGYSQGTPWHSPRLTEREELTRRSEIYALSDHGVCP